MSKATALCYVDVGSLFYSFKHTRFLTEVDENVAVCLCHFLFHFVLTDISQMCEEIPSFLQEGNRTI